VLPEAGDAVDDEELEEFEVPIHEVVGVQVRMEGKIQLMSLR
jgi:hypothetical protein